MARSVGLAMLAYFLIFSAWSLALHGHLETGIFDLGIHVQAMWLIFHGLPDFLTTRGLTMMSDHFTPVLYLLSPLCSAPRILIFQTLALASGAWPMYRLARHDLGNERAAFGFALAYLLQPGLWSANLFDFHTPTLAAPLLLWALWGLHGARPWLYWSCLLLTLTLGEALGVSVALLGLEAWRMKRRFTAAATLILGVTGCVSALLVMRAANHGEPSQYQALYHGFTLNGLDGLAYLALLLLPLAGLPLGGWRRLVPALPVVLGNLLSWRLGQRTLDHHYVATILPFLLWAAVAGWRRWRLGWPALLALAALSVGLHFSQLKVLGRPLADLRLLSQIPAGASVSADNGPGAHLSERSRLFLFPNPFQPLCWGNRAESLVETVGLAGLPPLPGDLRRRLQQCPVDYIVAQEGGDSWPLHPEDKAYWLRELQRSQLYESLPGGVWRRRRPGAFQPPQAQLHPRLSWDGQVLVCDEPAGVTLRSAAGAKVLASGFTPDLSADGTRVVFVSEDSRLVAGDDNASMDCFVWQGGVVQRLPGAGPVGQVSAYWPRWSAQGQVLCLGYGARRQPQPGGASGLWLGPVQGDWGTVVTGTGELRCRNRISGQEFAGCIPQAAGGRLVFARQVEGIYQLFDHELQLTHGGQDQLEPSLSDDGNWLAYTAFNQDGSCSIRLRDLRVGSERDMGEGYNPCLSGDGKQLAWARGERVDSAPTQ